MFNDASVTMSGSKEDLNKSNIKLDSLLTRGIYRGSLLYFNASFINKLEGKFMIDNKEYYFDGYTKDSKIAEKVGSVYESNGSDRIAYWLKMKDLNTIHLVGIGENNYNYEAVLKR